MYLCFFFFLVGGGGAYYRNFTVYFYDTEARNHTHICRSATSTLSLKKPNIFKNFKNSLFLSRHQIHKDLFRLTWKNAGCYTYRCNLIWLNKIISSSPEF